MPGDVLLPRDGAHDTREAEALANALEPEKPALATPTFSPTPQELPQGPAPVGQPDPRSGQAQPTIAQLRADADRRAIARQLGVDPNPLEPAGEDASPPQEPPTALFGGPTS